MHISEGVLSPTVLLSGAAITTAGVAVGLKGVDYEDISSMGMLSAAFFVASLVHVPVGPASAHLLLNGLLGLILGWKAFPSILVALALQGLLFQFGGITTLGVNTLNMAFPAIICYYLFGWAVRICTRQPLFTLAAFASGASAVFLSGIMVGFSLYWTGEAFLPAAKLVVAGHLPVMITEGLLTAACSLFLRRVRPELLEGQYVPKDALQR